MVFEKSVGESCIVFRVLPVKYYNISLGNDFFLSFQVGREKFNFRVPLGAWINIILK